MAEVVGVVASSLTLGALFKACLDGFELIQIARGADADLQKLGLLLRIEQCRLYTWGEAMGITSSPCPGSSRASPADALRALPLVEETLRMILRLFGDSENIKQRYGCRENENTTTGTTGATARSASSKKRKVSDEHYQDAVQDLTVSFSHFTTTAAANFMGGKPSPELLSGGGLLRKVRWVVRDKEKFECLVADVEAFITGLTHITKAISTPSRQESIVRYRVQTIPNPETLQLVSSASETDYPDISDAASLKVDVLSTQTCKMRDINAWIESASPVLLQPINTTGISGRNPETPPQPQQQQQQQEEDRVEEKNSSSSSATSSEVVITYLKQRGFHETAQAFATESTLRAYHSVEGGGGDDDHDHDPTPAPGADNDDGYYYYSEEIMMGGGGAAAAVHADGAANLLMEIEKFAKERVGYVTGLNRALLEENKKLSDLTRMLLSSPHFSEVLDALEAAKDNNANIASPHVFTSEVEERELPA